MTQHRDPDTLDEDGGLAQTVREVERMTANATVERPELVKPDALSELDHVLTYVARPGDEVHVRDLEALLERPTRARGTYTVYDADSFVRLVERQQLQEQITLWAQQPSTGAAKPSITAVLNDHASAAALAIGWRDHRAVLEIRPDPDWQQWQARDCGAVGGQSRWMDQVTFAEFVIDQTQNIVGAGELYLAATTFEARRNLTVQSVINLDDGSTEMQYTETVGNRENAGAVTLPTRLIVNLRPFYGADPVPQDVLLRHRVGKDGVKFGLFLHRPDLTIERAWNTWCGSVAERLPELPLFQGAPPEALAGRPVDTAGPLIRSAHGASGR